jgi:hypothetical protein
VLESALVESFIATFAGYGNVKAPYWFIGKVCARRPLAFHLSRCSTTVFVEAVEKGLFRCDRHRRGCFCGECGVW